MAQHLVVFASLLAIVSAIHWDGATPTAVVSLTTSPTPLTTSPITKDSVDRLLRRDAYPVSVCGWIGGDGELPAYCSKHSSCVWNTDNRFVGCCATASRACQFYTSCIDMNSDKPDGDYNDVYTCRGTSLCYLNSYWSGFSQWGCGSPKDATTVMSSYDGMNPDLSLQIIYTGGSGVPPADRTSPPTITSSGDSPSQISESSSLTNSKAAPEEETEITTVITVSGSDPSNDGSKSEGSDNNNNPHLTTMVVTLTPSATKDELQPPATSTSDDDDDDDNDALSTSTSSKSENNSPLGPIVGGTIGGVAALAIIVALGIFCYRRKRQRTMEQQGSILHYPNGMAVFDGSPMYGHSPGMSVGGWTPSLHTSPVFETQGKVICELPGSLDARSR